MYSLVGIQYRRLDQSYILERKHWDSLDGDYHQDNVILDSTVHDSQAGGTLQDRWDKHRHRTLVEVGETVDKIGNNQMVPDHPLQLPDKRQRMCQDREERDYHLDKSGLLTMLVGRLGKPLVPALVDALGNPLVTWLVHSLVDWLESELVDPWVTVMVDPLVLSLE